MRQQLLGTSSKADNLIWAGCFPYLWLIGLLLCLIAQPSRAQGVAPSENGLAIESVRISLSNPSPDPALNQRIEDKVRRTLALFPRERFSREVSDFAMSRARRLPDIADAEYTIEFGPRGGIVVDIRITLRDAAAEAKPKGMLATRSTADFPVLYDANGAFFKLKLEAFGLYYGNHNAWYGRPDSMLAGNPLAVGEAAGSGFDGWFESYLHAGLYGIAPLTPEAYVYGGGSTMATFSVGQELFTDKTRAYGAVEDAYLGLITGRTYDNGDRWVLNISAGRQRFTLGDGFLIANTAGNGDNRAALQANARWAADFVGLAQFRYNDTRLEVFRVDPDEIPILDSRTIIDGINLESELMPGLTAAASYLEVPRSGAGYFKPDGTRLEREGLRVYNLRARWQPTTGKPGLFLAGEAGRQENSNFPMRAIAYYGELGYVFSDRRWSPTLSYRYARFSGDDAGTDRFERWDPLLSGGNGEQWVQGINHFKVVQDSNVVAHRLQARLRPHAKFELVPQLWVFRADSALNLGGNPALSFLQSKDYGKEFNVTGKLFWSRHLYIHGHIAATFPGDAVEKALDSTQKDWWSTMLFVRYAY